MKRFLTLLACIIAIGSLSAQNLNTQPKPVNWAVSYKAISATEGEVLLVATIEKSWHTYSQKPTDAGPISTTIKFEPSKSYELVGKTEESESHEAYDKTFEARVYSFSDKAEFRQKVKIKGKAGFTIRVKVEFICCNDRMCMPPETVELSVKAQ